MLSNFARCTPAQEAFSIFTPELFFTHSFAPFRQDFSPYSAKISFSQSKIDKIRKDPYLVNHIWTYGQNLSCIKLGLRVFLVSAREDNPEQILPFKPINSPPGIKLDKKWCWDWGLEIGLITRHLASSLI